MFILKFCLTAIVAISVCIYLYFPSALPETESTVPANREALVFALFAASLFLVSLVPTNQPEHRNHLLLTGFLQLMAGVATFVAALQVIADVEATFSTNQLYALWGVVLAGLGAAVLSYGAFWWKVYRRYKENQ